jgi:hypothetical protein
MIALVALVIILYGASLIGLKDLWWLDKALMFHYMGKNVERTEEWDHDQDNLGHFAIGAGALLLLYYIVTLFA